MVPRSKRTQVGCGVAVLSLTRVLLTFQVDKAFTATYETKITPLAIAVFLKYNKGEASCGVFARDALGVARSLY